MKRSALVLSLLLATGAVQAHDDDNGHHVSCNVDSKYALDTYRNAFVLTQEDGKPARISFGGGKLFIDGREAPLTPADQQRMREFEGELRQLLPEMQKITIEAIDIAFTALTEVARGLSSNPDKSVAKLKRSQALALRELNSQPSWMFGRDADDDAVAAIIDPIVSDFVPEITGSAVTMAMKAVFASEEERQAMEARMQKMGDALDSKIDARAKALEPQAEAMCGRLRRMDAIDNALDYRLPSGKPIELLHVDVKETTNAP